VSDTDAHEAEPEPKSTYSQADKFILLAIIFILNLVANATQQYE